MTKVKVFLPLLACLFLLTSCSWFHKKNSNDNSFVSYIDIGRIIDTDEIKKGGTIAVIPFKAGPDVIASDKLDKTSLMIVRGISETLESGSGQIFTFATAQQAENADFFIEGHIISIQKPSRMKRWFLRKKYVELTVKGRLKSVHIDKTLLFFEDKVRMDKKKLKKIKDIDSAYKELGYEAGANIANYLLSIVNANEASI